MDTLEASLFLVCCRITFAPIIVSPLTFASVLISSQFNWKYGCSISKSSEGNNAQPEDFLFKRRWLSHTESIKL
jgi:hypothetical protein